MTIAQVRIVIAAVAFALSLPACSHSVARLSSLDPSERAAAIVAAAESGDTQSVHKLVELLEDRDLGVRMYANLALLRLCGVDYGFHYYDPEPLRSQAVDRWQAAIRDGAVTIEPGAAHTAPVISANPGAPESPEDRASVAERAPVRSGPP